MAVTVNNGVSGGAGGSVAASTFSAITGSPTDNALLASNLASKLSLAVPWDPVTNNLSLASGVSSNNGAVYSTAASPTAITVPITATVYTNDWLVFNPSVNQWQLISYLQNVGSAPDLLTVDLSNNSTIATLAANINSNTTAISNIKSLPTSTTFSTIWDTTSTKDLGDNTVSAPVAITTTTIGSIVGGYTQATFIADGTNIPTIDGTAVAGYTNTASVRNRVKLERVGNSTYVVCSGGGSGLTKSAYALPTITGSPVPIASFDFGDTSKITLSSGTAGAGGAIASIAGSDGTSFTLSQATTAKQPTSVIRNGQLTARFTSASAQYLSVASNMSRSSSTTGYTMIAVVEFATNTATQAVAELGANGVTFSNSRDILLASSTGGYSFRQMDNSGGAASSNLGSSFTSALHLMVGRMPAGTTTLSAKLNMDGTATTVVTGTTTSTMTVNTFTLGASQNSSVTLPLDGWLTRVWTFNTELTDAQIEQFAVALATNYGTPNVA